MTVDKQELARVERTARRALHRAGVRYADRRQLLGELRGEMEAAAADGRPLSSVVGADPASMVRSWAEGQGLDGRRLRLAVLIPGVLVPVALGGSALFVLLAFAFTGRNDDVMSTGALLAFYLGFGILAVGAGVAGCLASLTFVGDAAAMATTRRLAWTLPIGGGVATLAGVSAAALLHFRVEPVTFVVVGVAIAACLTATVVVTRQWVVRERTGAHAPPRLQSVAP